MASQLGGGTGSGRDDESARMDAWLADRFGANAGTTASVGGGGGDASFSAYGSRSGVGHSAGDLVGSAGALHAATSAAMSRTYKLMATKRHDRIDRDRKKN